MQIDQNYLNDVDRVARAKVLKQLFDQFNVTNVQFNAVSILFTMDGDEVINIPR